MLLNECTQFDVGRTGYGSVDVLADAGDDYYVNAYRGSNRETIADDLTASEAAELIDTLNRVFKV